MPKCLIDDKEIEVAQGTTVIEAARLLGIDIPHFCWHPDLAVDGNCRMCLVEVEKMPKLQISCNTVVTDGMVVRTNTPKVVEARRTTLEFLLVNHPIDCPVCDQAGECYLQDQYMGHGLHESGTPLEAKVHKRKLVDLGPIVLDAERCVLCTRCLRFEREVTGTNSLMFVQRGNQTQIASFEDRPISHAYAGNLADVCPVGALLSRDFRFKMRVWFLSSTESICPGCSTGCNVFIDHRDDEVYRLRPRRNVDVNRSWLCDPGRAQYKRLRKDRLDKARRHDDTRWVDTAMPEALSLLTDRLRGAGDAVAIVATPQATNEDLLTLRALAEATSARLDFRVNDPHLKVREREDQILQRTDKNPNTQGCLDLGLGRDGIDAVLEACRSGSIKVLLLQGPELLRLPAAGMFLASVPFVAVMATHEEPALERAHLVLPVADWAETDGSFTNYARRVQRIRRAVPPPGDALPRWEIVASVLRALGREIPAASAREAFAQLAPSVSDYAGLDHGKLGTSGVALPVPEEAA